MGLQQIVLKTSDGDCPVAIVTPEGTGPWPAVVLFMDAGGLRPGIIAMATRLAGAGYMVLVPDLFYRFGPYAPLVPAEVFKGDFRAILGPMMATTNNHKAAADTGPLLDWLGLHPDAIVRTNRMDRASNPGRSRVIRRPGPASVGWGSAS